MMDLSSYGIFIIKLFNYDKNSAEFKNTNEKVLKVETYSDHLHF